MCNKKKKNLPGEGWAQVHGFNQMFKVKLGSYSLDLLGDHHGVLFADLGGGVRLVVVRAVVLIGVTVDTAKQIPTATIKTWGEKKGVKTFLPTFGTFKC